RPRHDVVAESHFQFCERGMNAVGNLAGCFFSERDENDSLRRHFLVLEHDPQHFGDDRRRLAGAGAGLDHEVAALRHWTREVECLLLRHRNSCSSVRGSRDRVTAYFSSGSCFVRQESFTAQYLHELKSLSFSFGNAGKWPRKIADAKMSSVCCSPSCLSARSNAKLVAFASPATIGLIVPLTCPGSTLKNSETAIAYMASCNRTPRSIFLLRS